ncbi:MAG: NAD(P)(+) transhydrogenase (Re/Si-specific) subunit alpha, partial [Myxococcales bacterium]|nr:NAD(P)(+) transhydrogenase (Re/Si-specific) subunit alpha [Myxococcales bacterium]
MIVGVPKEILPGERRVALVPAAAEALISEGLEVVVESGAGTEAGFLDGVYEAAGATLLPDSDAVLSSA